MGSGLSTTAATTHRNGVVQELPEAGLAALLWLPVAAFVTLLVTIAGACVVYLNVPVAAGVPASVLAAERRQVALLARAAGGAAAGDVEDLRGTVMRSAGLSPEQVVRGVLDGPGRWRGAVIVPGGAATGAPQLASAGESIPPLRAPVGGEGGAPAVQITASADGPPALVTSVPLGANVVLASSRIQLPEMGSGGTPRWLWLTDSSGRITPVTGNPPVPAGMDGPALTDFVAQAAATGVGTGAPGELVGPTDDAGNANVATFAPVIVSDLSTGSGISLITAIQTPTEPGAPGGQGNPAAAALLALALGGGALIYLTLVRPIRRLRAAALRLAGGDVSQAPDSSRITEVADIAAAFAYCRDELLHLPPTTPTRLRRWPARRGVVIAAIGVVVWSVLVVYLAPTYLGQPTVPEAVTVDAQQRVGLIADQAADSLNQGVADLRQTVAAVGSDRAALEPAWNQLLAASGRFRGMRLVDSTGTTLLSVGRPLLTGGVIDRDGLSVAATDQVPVPTARVGLADGTAVLAEFDVQRLAALLAMSPVRTRLLDGQLRTVSDTQGFLAFAPVPDGARRDVAEQALRNEAPAGRVDDDAVLAAAPVGPGPAAARGWVALAEEPVQALPLSRTKLQRRVAVLAVAAATVAIVVWAVYYMWHVRPLRRGARMATALRNGDRDSVIFPQYQGAVDTTVRCLDICRRALSSGPQQLGPRVPRSGHPSSHNDARED